MVFTIARKEFKETLRDGRFRLMAGIVLTLLFVALAAGWKHYAQTQAERAAARVEARDIWLTQGAKNPHSAAHYGTYAFKPQLPLALVDQGTNPFTGVAVYLEAHKQNNVKYLPAQDSTGLRRFGELTASTALQILTPLVIILLAFSAFAGERENGALRQLLSLGVRPRALAFGKGLGIACALGLLLVPATIIGVAALGLSAAGGAYVPTGARSLWMGLGYLLYFGAFAALSLAVSARASSARIALVALLGFWGIGAVIAPRVAADVSKRVAPTPSAVQFWTNVASDLSSVGIEGHNSSKHHAALRARVLEQYGVDKVEDLPFNFAGVALQSGEESSNRVYDRRFTELWDGYERQGRVQVWGALVAPILAVRSLSMGMAGTDFAHHRHFAAAAEDYRRRMVKLLNDDVAYSPKGEEWTYVADRRMWERLADFEYALPGVAWALRKQATSLSLLLVWFAGSSIFAYVSIARMKVS
jgi:ABC-2 type transport system permease protein